MCAHPVTLEELLCVHNQLCVHSQGLYAFGQKRRDKWKCITRLFSYGVAFLVITVLTSLYTLTCLVFKKVYLFVYLAMPALKLQHAGSLGTACELLVAT